MTGAASFKLELVNGIPVVDVIGEVDMTNSHELEGLLDQASRSGPPKVIVVLTGATYLDSKGVRLLLRSAERLALIRQRLLVVAPGGSVPRRILDIAGADNIPIFDSLGDAITA